MIIGQDALLEEIKDLIKNNKFPRFSVITGKKGQGKTMLASYICNELDRYLIDNNENGCYMVEIDNKIDSIREMIDMAYKQTEPIIYLIQNADRMSIGAKNSLLKVIEEPPQQAYFIMELQQIENTLETIKSRCREFKMTNYKREHMEQMMKQINPNVTNEESTVLKQICTNWYEVETLIKYNPVEFYNYCLKVFNNIHTVQSANSFKIAEKLDIKGTGEGYDLQLFFKMYIYLCLEKLINEELNDDMVTILTNCIETSVKFFNRLNINGINKQSVLDIWILEIRKEWLK